MRRLRPYVFILLLMLALISVWVALANHVLPRRLFRKAVLDPIPPSVRRIRADASSDSDSHTYVLRFDINEADVQLILAADQFKEIGYVEYRGDSRLSFGETSNVRTMLVLFGAWNPKPPPRWFKFADWKAFKAYVVKEEEGNYFWKVRLLLYNPGIGQAYFVEDKACF